MAEDAEHGIVDEPPARLRIQLLGRFRVWIDDREIADDEWRLKKLRKLVKVLAISPELKLPRRQLQQLLWPDSPPEASYNALLQWLHRGRYTLEPHKRTRTDRRTFLLVEGELLVLGPPEVIWIDVRAFRTRARAALSSSDPARYRAALALYGGDLLSGDTDWDLDPVGSDAAGVTAVRAELRGLYEDLLLGLRQLEPANRGIFPWSDR